MPEQQPLPPMAERCLKIDLSPEAQDYLERARAAKQAYMEALERGENPPMWTALQPKDYETLLKSPDEPEHPSNSRSNSQVWPISLMEHPLNRAAVQLLKLRGVPVAAGTAPLSQAVIEALNHWNPLGDRDSQVLLRLAALGEAESPARFAQTLRPFMGPLAWDPIQAEREGLSPYGPGSLDQFTSTNLAEEAGKCHSLSELLNILEGQEAKTFEMTT